MNRRRALVALLASAVPVASLAGACDDGPLPISVVDAGSSGGDTSTPDGPGVTDAPASDTGFDGGVDARVTPEQLAKFNAGNGELAEGIAIVPGDAGSGFPVVGFAPLGKVVQVLADGGILDYATFAGASQTYTLGLAVDGARNLYVAIAQTGGTPTPPPGVYKVPFGGGTPTPFAISTGKAMAFVNGLAFKGTDLFITDSTGTIFKADVNGLTSEWLTDTALAGDENDCKLGNGFPIGANGIAVDATNVYVTNTDKGTLHKIAINGNGTAGAITLVKKDPALCGADGLVLDKDGTLLVAVNAKNAIVRVTPAGVITTISQGAPLDSPASLWIDTTGATGSGRRLLVTNAAFASAQTDGGKPNPGLLSLPLAP